MPTHSADLRLVQLPPRDGGQVFDSLGASLACLVYRLGPVNLAIGDQAVIFGRVPSDEHWDVLAWRVEESLPQAWDDRLNLSVLLPYVTIQTTGAVRSDPTSSLHERIFWKTPKTGAVVAWASAAGAQQGARLRWHTFRRSALEDDLSPAMPSSLEAPLHVWPGGLQFSTDSRMATVADAAFRQDLRLLVVRSPRAQAWRRSTLPRRQDLLKAVDHLLSKQNREG